MPHSQQRHAYKSNTHKIRRYSFVSVCGFLMAADSATCLSLPHPRPGRAAAVGPRLYIRQGKFLII